MTTREFIYKALSGKTKKTFCSSVFVSDGVAYSYGYHYPLATIIDGKGYVNDRGYSNSTAKHINWAFSALGELVGYDNVYHSPLFGGSLSKRGIREGAQAEYDRLTDEMNAKKRKDTKVYKWLEVQQTRASKTLKAIS